MIPYKPRDLIPRYWNDIDPCRNRPMCYFLKILNRGKKVIELSIEGYKTR
jgi:hypothetical protein